MHRNTYLLIVFLAVFAALIVTINLYRFFTTAKTREQPATTTAHSAPTPIPADAWGVYTNTRCGFSLEYPLTLTKQEDASTSSVSLNSAGGQQIIAIACKNNIPRPATSSSNIQTTVVTNDAKSASAEATLYHDSSGTNGSQIDAFIFRIPDTTLDVFIAGFGDTFNQIIQTVKLTH